MVIGMETSLVLWQEHCGSFLHIELAACHPDRKEVVLPGGGH